VVWARRLPPMGGPRSSDDLFVSQIVGGWGGGRGWFETESETETPNTLTDPQPRRPPSEARKSTRSEATSGGVRGAEADQAGALPRKAVLGWHDGSMKVEAR
jgi:hypothetical protein